MSESFFKIKLQAEKGDSTQVFSCEFCEPFRKNTYGLLFLLISMLELQLSKMNVFELLLNYCFTVDLRRGLPNNYLGIPAK